MALFFPTLRARRRRADPQSWTCHLDPVGSLHVDFGLRLDPLSLTFVLLITGVGSLIHIYSIGYMSHDPGGGGSSRYLNLFVAAMLLLVLGNTFVTLYVGWEGVGLASYLLIGFWSGPAGAATAAKKAFIMNRVGDVGLALAIFLMFEKLGTTRFAGVFAGVGELAGGTVHRDRAAAAARRLRQVRSGPAAGLVARRHGGPDPGLRADPRRDDGHRRRVPDRPVQRRSYDLTAGRPAGGRDRRRGHAAGRVHRRLRQRRHQEGAGLLDGLPDRLHVPGRRARAGGYALGILHLLTHGFFKAGLFLGAGSVMHGDERRGRHAPVSAGWPGTCRSPSSPSAAATWR